MPETTFENIGEWHVPNRVIVASRQKTPMNQLLTFLPLRCHWCKRERSANKLTLSPSLDVVCIDWKKCNKFRTKNAPPPKRQMGEAKKKPSKDRTPPEKKKRRSRKATEPSPVESAPAICGEKHKVDGKTLKCRRKPDHAGKHRDKKDNKW